MNTPPRSEFDLRHKIGSITEVFGNIDTTQIFVHFLDSLPNIKALQTIVRGLEKYPERALVLARSEDIVCVRNDVDDNYLRFLSRLGIGPKPSNVVTLSVEDSGGMNPAEVFEKERAAISTIRELAKNSKKLLVNPFVLSSKDFKLASILEEELNAKVAVFGGSVGIVEEANQKHRVRQKAIKLGIPVSEGEVVQLRNRQNLRPLQMAIERRIGITGKVIIKGTHGDAGSSTFIVENSSESIQGVLNNISQSDENDFYLVEPMFRLIVSPNIVMHIAVDGTIQCVGITDQILTEDLKHEGNIYPSSAKLLRPMLASSRKIGEWLQAEGYAGILGLDFAEYFDPATGERKYFLAEVNARINAGVYSRSLMESLNKCQRKNDFPSISAFISVNTRTRATSFVELTGLYEDLLFKPETGIGLVPYNTGCLKYGKFTAAIFGTTSDGAIRIHRELLNRTSTMRSSKGPDDTTDSAEVKKRRE